MPAKKKELNWDRKLNIQTIGRDDSAADAYHHPYEPTPYSVLERLAESGYIDQDNVVVDYGCGKGRVGSFSIMCWAVEPSVWNMMRGFFCRRCRIVIRIMKAWVKGRYPDR